MGIFIAASGVVNLRRHLCATLRSQGSNASVPVTGFGTPGTDSAVGQERAISAGLLQWILSARHRSPIRVHHGRAIPRARPSELYAARKKERLAIRPASAATYLSDRIRRESHWPEPLVRHRRTLHNRHMTAQRGRAILHRRQRRWVASPDVDRDSRSVLGLSIHLVAAEIPTVATASLRLAS